MRSFPVTDQVREYAVSQGSWRPDEVVKQLHKHVEYLGAICGARLVAEPTGAPFDAYRPGEPAAVY